MASLPASWARVSASLAVSESAVICFCRSVSLACRSEIDSGWPRPGSGPRRSWRPCPGHLSHLLLDVLLGGAARGARPATTTSTTAGTRVFRIFHLRVSIVVSRSRRHRSRTITQFGVSDIPALARRGAPRGIRLTPRGRPAPRVTPLPHTARHRPRAEPGPESAGTSRRRAGARLVLHSSHGKGWMPTVGKPVALGNRDRGGRNRQRTHEVRLHQGMAVLAVLAVEQHEPRADVEVGRRARRSNRRSAARTTRLPIQSA